MNISLLKNDSNSRFNSVENLRILEEVKEVKERRSIYEGYDSNYDNSVFIETPRDGKRKLLLDDNWIICIFLELRISYSLSLKDFYLHWNQLCQCWKF